MNIDSIESLSIKNIEELYNDIFLASCGHGRCSSLSPNPGKSCFAGGWTTTGACFSCWVYGPYSSKSCAEYLPSLGRTWSADYQCTTCDGTNWQYSP